MMINHNMICLGIFHFHYSLTIISKMNKTVCMRINALISFYFIIIVTIMRFKIMACYNNFYPFAFELNQPFAYTFFFA